MSDVIDMPPSGRPPEATSGLKTVTMAVYVLQALSFFWGLPAIVALIINYVKREDARGTVYASHFDWQIGTFWWGLLWTVLGMVLIWAFGLGLLILGVAYIWLIYRVVKGFLRLTEGRPVRPA
jgi:uncharacterized membrane protein